MSTGLIGPETLFVLNWMRERGSSLTISYSEEDFAGCWEVTWVTSGRRYLGRAQELPNALYAALDQAGVAEACSLDLVDYLSESSR